MGKHFAASGAQGGFNKQVNKGENERVRLSLHGKAEWAGAEPIEAFF